MPSSWHRGSGSCGFSAATQVLGTLGGAPQGSWPGQATCRGRAGATSSLCVKADVNTHLFHEALLGSSSPHGGPFPRPSVR